MTKHSHTDTESDKAVIKENKTRKSIIENGRSILEINLEYPEIIPDNTSFSKAFNSFYANIGKNYLEYCEKKLLKRIKQRHSSDKASMAFGEIMRFFVTRNCDKYLSIVTDISHFNGYFTDKTRFSCVWEKEKCRILPYSYFLEKEKMSVREVRNKIKDTIEKELRAGDPQFAYTEDNVRKYASRVKPENYFITDSGIAFWFSPGTLAPASEGFPTFVIKNDNFLQSDNN